MPMLPQTKTHTSVTAVLPATVGVGRKTPTSRRGMIMLQLNATLVFFSFNGLLSTRALAFQK